MGDEAAAPQLSISLVIPMRDEEASIESLIHSILSQALVPSEIILVDAGSKDRTAEFARRLTAGNSRFRIVEAGPAWPGKARNIGVQAATCEWIAFTDAGITLDRNWLFQLARKAEQDPSLDVIYGNFEPEIKKKIDRLALLTWLPPLQEHDGKLMRGPVIPSSLIRKRVIEEAGGFPDFRASEDLLLMEEIEKRGAKIGWQPYAVVQWSLPPTFGKTFARFRLYSRHNVYSGRQKYWHYGVLRIYLLLIAIFLFGLLRWPQLWFAIPLIFAARVAKLIFLRTRMQPVGFLINPLDVLGCLALLIVLDAATFTGWCEAEMDRICKRAFFARVESEG